MTRLKDDETVILDIGNESGISVRNLIDDEVRIFVDHQLDNGQWSAITGTVRLAAGETFQRTRIDLGYERVRVGVRGEEAGRDLVEVRP